MNRVVVGAVEGDLNLPDNAWDYLSGTHVTICKFSKEDASAFRPVGSMVRRFVKRSMEKGLSRRHREALDLLCPANLLFPPGDVQPAVGTCQWISDCLEYKRWKSETTNQLWISGGPGYGKTYLAKHIASQQLTEAETTQEGSSLRRKLIQCFIRKEADVGSVLRSALRQVLQDEPGITERLDTFTRRFPSPSDRSCILELKQLFREVMAEVSQTEKLTMIVDNLDSLTSEDQLHLLDAVRDLESDLNKYNHLTRFRLLILSRNCNTFITARTRGFETYQISDGDTAKDVCCIIETGMQHIAPKLKPAVVQSACKKIAQAAKGMLLYAAVVLKDVEHGLATEGDIEERLSDLPRELAELYDAILGRMVRDRAGLGSLAGILLRWVTFCHRGLTPAELNVALALSRARKNIEDGRNNGSKCSGATLDRRAVEKYLIKGAWVKAELYRICGQLVRLSPSTGTYELVHDTFEQYLTTRIQVVMDTTTWAIPNHPRFYMRKEEAHAILGNHCIDYLMLDYFEDPVEGLSTVVMDLNRPTIWAKKVQERIHTHKFSSYAALSWSQHLDAADPRMVDSIKSEMLRDITQPHAISWMEVWWYLMRWPAYKIPNVSIDTIKTLSPLPARIGDLAHLLPWVPPQTFPPSPEDSRPGTPVDERPSGSDVLVDEQPKLTNGNITAPKTPEDVLLNQPKPSTSSTSPGADIHFPSPALEIPPPAEALGEERKDNNHGEDASLNPVPGQAAVASTQPNSVLSTKAVSPEEPEGRARLEDAMPYQEEPQMTGPEDAIAGTPNGHNDTAAQKTGDKCPVSVHDAPLGWFQRLLKCLRRMCACFAWRLW